MRIEPLPEVEEAIPLLNQCALPVTDIPPATPHRFFCIRLGGTLAGVVGIELYAPVGLLRSLAVAPALRGRGIAHKLVEHAESFACAHGIESLFILTTSAAEFFLQLGYAPTARINAPPAIQGTAQFSTLCPSSSAFLSRQLPQRATR